MKKVQPIITEFNCYYNNFKCPFINSETGFMEKQCNRCEHYNNGVRKTGGMPVIEKVFRLVKSLFDKIT